MYVRFIMDMLEEGWEVSHAYSFIYAKNTLGRTPSLCLCNYIIHRLTTHIPMSQTENFQAQPTTPPGGHKNSTL